MQLHYLTLVGSPPDEVFIHFKAGTGVVICIIQFASNLQSYHVVGLMTTSTSSGPWMDLCISVEWLVIIAVLK